MNNPLKIGVVSLGCSKNRIDTEQLLGVLCEEGYQITPDIHEAQIIVINTCAFIQSAKEESIEAILEVVEQKKVNSNLKVIVTGCLPERYRETLSQEIPEVDGWIGVNQYGMMADIVKAVSLGDHKEEFEVFSSPLATRVLTTPSHLAYVRIAEGCDHRCSYCVIPSIRGRYKSRPMEEIAKECEVLCHRGVKEIVLLAQDTSYYGKDLYGSLMLSELLKELSGIGIPWIRVLYTYPERIDEDLLHAMETLPNIIPYLDMPLQHVNTEILQNMGRAMTREKIETLIESIGKSKKPFTLRTTFISGFPGENETQHEELRQFILRGYFDHVGVFAYSQEEGTRAALMEGQWDEATKKRRANSLMLAQQQISRKVKQRYVDKTADVILESIDSKGQGIGRTSWQAPEVDGIIRVDGCTRQQIGQIIPCLIRKADAYDLKGEWNHDACK